MDHQAFLLGCRGVAEGRESSPLSRLEVAEGSESSPLVRLEVAEGRARRESLEGGEGNMLSVFVSLSMVFRSLGLGLPREKKQIFMSVFSRNFSLSLGEEGFLVLSGWVCYWSRSRKEFLSLWSRENRLQLLHECPVILFKLCDSLFK